MRRLEERKKQEEREAEPGYVFRPAAELASRSSLLCTGMARCTSGNRATLLAPLSISLFGYAHRLSGQTRRQKEEKKDKLAIMGGEPGRYD